MSITSFDRLVLIVCIMYMSYIVLAMLFNDHDIQGLSVYIGLHKE